MSETCQQIKRLEKMETAIYGDGGLKDVVSRLDVTVKGVSESIDRNATVQSALLKFMNEEKGKYLAKKEHRASNKWLIGIIVTLSLTLLGVIVKVL